MEEFSPYRKVIPGRNLAEFCLMLDRLYSCSGKSMLLAIQHLPYYKYDINSTEKITTTSSDAPRKNRNPTPAEWKVNAKVFILQTLELSMKII